MNFLKKKKEPIVKSNGKIVITDFSELNPNDFPDNQSPNFEEQLAVLSSDGKVFVNKEKEEYELSLIHI